MIRKDIVSYHKIHYPALELTPCVSTVSHHPPLYNPAKINNLLTSPPKNKKEHERNWRLANPEKVKAIHARYWEKHQPEIAVKREAYRETPKGQEAYHRLWNKERGLGYIPLNKYFPGSQQHHIDKDRVIFMPKKLHKTTLHWLAKNIGMEKINKLAFDFLKQQQGGLLSC